VNVSVRLGEDLKLCLLVMIGVREDDEKELLAVEDGYRESEDSWAAVFRDLRDRGMNEPKLVTGDGRSVRGQRCATYFPQPGSSAARLIRPRTASTRSPSGCNRGRKTLLHEMAQAPTRADARLALGRFRDPFDATYPKAVSKLDKDWEQLTAFYDFPVEHWRHLRTTDPIESSFATVTLRTKVTKGRDPAACRGSPRHT
jgi:putative transposase